MKPRVYIECHKHKSSKWFGFILFMLWFKRFIYLYIVLDNGQRKEFEIKINKIAVLTSNTYTRRCPAIKSQKLTYNSIYYSIRSYGYEANFSESHLNSVKHQNTFSVKHIAFILELVIIHSEYTETGALQSLLWETFFACSWFCHQIRSPSPSAIYILIWK